MAEYATVQTGPHSQAQGERIGQTAKKTGRDTVSVGYNKYKTGTLISPYANNYEGEPAGMTRPGNVIHDC